MTTEQERAAFFAWVADCGCDTDGAWSAWQARAALASQAQPVAWRFKERINGEFDSDWILTKHEPANGVRIIAKEPLYAAPLAAGEPHTDGVALPRDDQQENGNG